MKLIQFKINLINWPPVVSKVSHIQSLINRADSRKWCCCDLNTTILHNSFLSQNGSIFQWFALCFQVVIHVQDNTLNKTSVTYHEFQFQMLLQQHSLSLFRMLSFDSL